MVSLPKTSTLELEFDNAQGWLTVWLNRPDQRNALSAELVGELQATFNAIRDDRSVRGITLRGRGAVFCAGGDLNSFQALMSGTAIRDEVKSANKSAGELFAMLNSMPQVVVMLVHGAAMAGGLGMVCCGDVVVVTKDAKFALTEVTLGIPPAQIAPLVVERLGLKPARRLMLTAARFDGVEAMKLGLADHVAVDEAGMDLIETDIRSQVINCAPGAVAATKEILLATRTLKGDAMIDFAAENFTNCLLSDEGKEGISAFLQKRKPDWSDK